MRENITCLADECLFGKNKPNMTSNSVWTLKGTGRQLRPAADKSKTTRIGGNKTSAVICSSDRYYKCVVEPRAPSVGEVHTGERLTAAKWSHEVVMGNSQNTETIRIFPGGVVLGVILDHLPNHKIYHFRRNHNSVSWWSGDQLIRTNRYPGSGIWFGSFPKSTPDFVFSAADLSENITEIHLRVSVRKHLRMPRQLTTIRWIDYNRFC